MNLPALFRAEVAEVRSSASSREEQQHSYDEKTLVEEELVGTGSDNSAEFDSGQSKIGGGMHKNARGGVACLRESIP